MSRFRGGERRLSPIILTALTRFPVWSGWRRHGTGSQMLQPLAVAVIGGIIASMALSFLVTPAVHYYLRGRSSWVILGSPRWILRSAPDFAIQPRKARCRRVVSQYTKCGTVFPVRRRMRQGSRVRNIRLSKSARRCCKSTILPESTPSYTADGSGLSCHFS